jgi:HlyD family secretion protein
MAKPNRKLLLFGLAAVGVLLAVLFIFRWVHPRTPSVLHVSGNIELTQVNISFKLPGKLAERRAEEGQPVKKGDILARLDQEQLLRQRDQVLAVLEGTRSRMAQLETAVEYGRASLSGNIEQRQAELRSAAANLRDLLAGSRPQEIENARAALDRTKAELGRAENDWKRAQMLYRNEDISTADFDAFKNRYESALAQTRQAEEQLKLVMEGPRKETIEVARAQENRAAATLKMAEAGRLDLKRLEQEVPVRKAEIAQAEASLGVINSQLSDSVALSPTDGVVLVKSAEPGEVLAAGTPVVTIGDLSKPWLRAYINERDLGKVKLGNKVKVTTDSYPDKISWGRISFIASEAEFTPKQIQTAEERVKLVYRIKIDVPNPDLVLKSNMPADAEIQLE